jgi:hypothetical protein
MHGPTASEKLRRALWNAIAEDDWAQADLDAAIQAREARSAARGHLSMPARRSAGAAGRSP